MKYSAALAVVFLSAADAAALEWKAGVVRATITPKEPMRMAGYAGRTKPAEGTAQELFAKALALEDAAGKRVVFITLDLIGVPRTLRDILTQRLGETHGLPPEGLLLNASHTHCGPSYHVAGKPGIFVEEDAPPGETYGAFLAETLFALAGEALGQLAPAQLSYHRARCGFSMNRRLPADGTFRNAPNPDGPVDQEVPVLRVSAPDGKVRALLFGYACHNTTLPFLQWCGDYAGYAQEYLEAAHPEAVALFMMGCGGDQNPYPRGKLELAQMHGRTLATAVGAALETPARPIAGSLRAAIGDVELEFAPVPARAELEERAKGSDKTTAAHAKRLLQRMDAGETIPTKYALPVQVVRFGDSLTFVGLAGETVVDYALRLKRELAGPVWIAGYCNDVMGYIPSRRVLEEGGYEGGGAMRYSRFPGPWAPSVEERIIGKTHELLRGLAR